MRSNIYNYIQNNGFEAFCPKAVLFDMDGVLYNSMPNHAVAWEESMKKFGINMTSSDAYATEGARGIDTIREKIISYASSSSLWGGEEKLKVIILEECDNLTNDAWSALRATIEQFNRTLT